MQRIWQKEADSEILRALLYETGCLRCNVEFQSDDVCWNQFCLKTVDFQPVGDQST